MATVCTSGKMIIILSYRPPAGGSVHDHPTRNPADGAFRSLLSTFASLLVQHFTPPLPRLSCSSQPPAHCLTPTPRSGQCPGYFFSPPQWRRTLAFLCDILGVWRECDSVSRLGSWQRIESIESEELTRCFGSFLGMRSEIYMISPALFLLQRSHRLY